MTRTQFQSFLLVVTFVWLFPASVVVEAQDYSLQGGAPPFTQTEEVELGFVNLANGNLHLEVPIVSIPQRGGGPFTASLVYDSRIWWKTCANAWSPYNIDQYCGGQPGYWGGWRLVTSADPGRNGGWTITQYNCTGPHGGYKNKYTNFAFKFPDGSTKAFLGITTWYYDSNCLMDGGTPVPTGSGYANDASGYLLKVSSYTAETVYAPDGTQVGTSLPFPTVNPIDANGNYMSRTSLSDSTKIDTVGRKPVVTITTCNGNPNQTCYDVLNSQGGTSRWTVTTATVPVSTNFQSGIIPEYSGNITVIQSILLPDGTNYSFAYDSGTTPGHFGEVTSVTLPTGGQIGYGYSVFSDIGAAVNRWVTSRTSGGGTWTYTPQVVVACTSTVLSCQQQVTVSKPNGDNTRLSFGFWSACVVPTCPRWGPGLTQVQSYAGAVAPANLMATVAATWNNSFTQKLSETATFPVAGGSNINRTRQFSYDTVNDQNMSQVSEWKHYTGSLPATPDRITATTYTQANSSYAAKNIINKPLAITIKNGSGIQLALTNHSYDSTSLMSVTGASHHDDTNFGISNTVRGNLTQVQKWSGGSNYLTRSMTYDTTGQVRSAQDPSLNSTSFNYADAFYDDNGANPPPAHSGVPFTNAYLTSINHPLSISESFGYYYGTGQEESHTDSNHNSTYFHYVDSFSRPTGTRFPDSGSVAMTYTGQNQSDVYTAVDASTTKHDEVILDSLGRTNQTILVSDPNGSDTVDFAYNTLGQLSSATNPHRSTSSSTDGTTTYVYDALGRIITTTEADGSQIHVYYGPSVSSNGGIGSQLCSAATYGLGYPTLSVDEAQKKRQSWTDGFGRLIEVDEPDSTGALSVPTCYAYDLLDNLTGVLQNGSRQRTFVYDSLSRLTSSTNPESGSVSYTYDANGNLLTKTAPAPNQTGSGTVTTCFGVWNGTSCDGTGYDALHRVTKKTYSNGDSTVTYSYDQTNCLSLPACSNIGRRTAMTDAAGSEAWAYDSMGRPLKDQRTTNSITKNTIYTYNLDGSVATLAYPTGRVITYAYSAAARPVSAIDTVNSINFVTSAAYAPTGALSSVTNGASLVETFHYNSRLQPCRISVKSSGTAPTQCTDAVNIGGILDFTYNFNVGVSDNGNVAGITNNRAGASGRSRLFSYDALNRILTAKTTSTSGTSCWDEQFGYDAWANLLTIGRISGYTCSNEELLNVTATTKNQISGYTYDAPGNLINDNLGHAYTFNAENQLLTAGSVTYTYDGDGKRVKKSNNKLYWYGTGSDPLTETDSAGSASAVYIFFGGKRTARIDVPSLVVHYYFSDHLSSANVVTSSAGVIQDESDYYPFGGERIITNSDPNNYKFTGKERDSESGNDYFGLRYFGSSVGRFMSPDSIANDWELANPQTWNRYAYARNNPLIYVDPDGAAAELICTGDNAYECKVQRERELKELQDSLGDKDAASRLYINEVKDGDNTRYFVGIKGDVGDFMKLGDTAHDLANIVQDKQVVEFGLTKSDLSQWGGAITYAPGEAPGGSNQNVRVLVNTQQAVDLASTILGQTVLGAGRMGGQNERPPWRIRDMTQGIAVWHELGHGWGYIHGRVGSRSNQEAVDWENRMRQQVYGPIGPNNAPRARD